MTRELITTWGDYKAALSTLLPLAEQHLLIYDQDLGQLQLDDIKHNEQLHRLLCNKQATLQIAVRSSQLLRTQHPRLLQLASIYNHRVSLQESTPNLAHLRDCLIVVDARHALIRFDWEQPRAKLLLDEPEEVRQYQLRFKDIVAEGGEIISPTTLGL